MSFHAEVLCYPISMPRADDNPWVALWHCLTKRRKETRQGQQISYWADLIDAIRWKNHHVKAPEAGPGTAPCPIHT